MKNLWVLGFLLGGTLQVWGQDLLTMQAAQFEWRENCLASQSFASKVEAEITVKSAAQKEVEEIQKNAQEALLKCASEKGVKGLTTEFELQKSLMACPVQYEEWAKSSPAKILLGVEIKELSSQLSRIKKFLKHSCLAMN